MKAKIKNIPIGTTDSGNIVQFVEKITVGKIYEIIPVDQSGWDGYYYIESTSGCVYPEEWLEIIKDD
jgi:hypothetical protein